MAKLGANERAQLPDRAFAYVDSRGRRRLPIHDAAHVKNALARFKQVAFESEAARERALERLLRAARKHGIVPVGFMTSQLRSEREQVASVVGAPANTDLPTGFITLLMADIEGSTVLLRHLGAEYRDLLDTVRALFREAVQRANGREVDVRADDAFAAFENAPDGVSAAVSFQRSVSARAWPQELAVRIRIGVHSGAVTLTDVGYIGLEVHTAARVCSAAHGGQVLVSGPTRDAVGDACEEFRFTSLGAHALAGLADEVALFQVEAEGLPDTFPPPRTPAARRRFDTAG